MNATIQIKFTNLMSSEINKPYKCLISNKKNCTGRMENTI